MRGAFFWDMSVVEHQIRLDGARDTIQLGIDAVSRTNLPISEIHIHILNLVSKEFFIVSPRPFHYMSRPTVWLETKRTFPNPLCH